jgi:acyl dehydratase
MVSVSPTWEDSEITFPLSVGQAFSRRVSFQAESVRAFATLAGDTNPLHHDERTARASRFGRLIAAGTQSSTMLAGAVAGNLCRLRPSLGLEMSFRFRRAVLIDEPLLAKWEIVSIQPNKRLDGDIVTIECDLRSKEGNLLVSGTVVSLVSY